MIIEKIVDKIVSKYESTDRKGNPKDFVAECFVNGGNMFKTCITIDLIPLFDYDKLIRKVKCHNKIEVLFEKWHKEEFDLKTEVRKATIKWFQKCFINSDMFNIDDIFSDVWYDMEFDFHIDRIDAEGCYDEIIEEEETIKILRESILKNINECAEYIMEGYYDETVYPRLSSEITDIVGEVDFIEIFTENLKAHMKKALTQY